MELFENIMSVWAGQEVLVIAIGVAFFSTIVMLYTLKKQNRLLAQINKLSEDLQVANRGAIGMGQQIIALEKKLQALSANPTLADDPVTEASATEHSVEDQSNYKVAMPVNEPTDGINEVKTDDKLELARVLLTKGQSLSEVASHCQLSFAEVSLLRALNPNNNTPQNQSPTH